MEPVKFDYPIELDELKELMDRIVNVFLDTLPTKNMLDFKAAKAAYLDNLLKRIELTEKNKPENLLDTGLHKAMTLSFSIRWMAEYITLIGMETDRMLDQQMANGEPEPKKGLIH